MNEEEEARLVELSRATIAAMDGMSAQVGRLASIEAEATSRIGLLIDPETPEEERERRIHRLTDGPPEFVAFRLDLPGRRLH